MQRSLVQEVAPVESERRYTMLQVLRDFGIEHLASLGQEDAARLAHARYVAQMAEEAEPHMTGGEQERWMRRLDAEMNNFRSAIDWAFANDQVVLVLRIGGSLWRHFASRALINDMRRWLDRALASRGPELTPYRTKALIGAGYLAEDKKDLETSRGYFEQALHLAEALGNRQAEGQALIGLGTVAHDSGEYDIAFGFHERALELARAANDRRGIAIGYGSLGAVAYYQGRMSQAMEFYAESNRMLEEVGDLGNAAIGASNIAAIASESGDFARAEESCRQAIELQTRLGNQRDLPSSLINLGEALRELGRHEEAGAAFRKAVVLAGENDDRFMRSLALHGLAVLEYVLRNVREAAALVLEGIELLAMMNDPHSMIENAHLVALLALGAGRYEDAATIIAANARLGEELGIGMLDRRRAKIEEMTRAAEAGAGEARFVAAWEAGQTLSIEDLTRRIAAVARGIVGPRHTLPAPVDVEVADELASQLTAREAEILRLLVEGKSTAEIAGDLFVSARTVTTHVTHILEKLGVPNRTAAVAYAVREGLV